MSGPSVVSLAGLRERLPFGPGSPARPTLWTGLALPGSDSHVVPDVLAPIMVDRGRDQVVYVEPGVWMLHA